MVEDQRPIIDPIELGRCVRAARVLAGMDNAGEVVEALAQIGVHASTRTLYAIERGQQLPHLDLFVGLVMILHPPEGQRFFDRALSPEALTAFTKGRGRP